MTRVTITHPELGEACVMSTSLKVWQARGWTVKAPDVVDAPPAAEPLVEELVQLPLEAAAENPERPMPS